MDGKLSLVEQKPSLRSRRSPVRSLRSRRSPAVTTEVDGLGTAGLQSLGYSKPSIRDPRERLNLRNDPVSAARLGLAGGAPRIFSITPMSELVADLDFGLTGFSTGFLAGGSVGAAARSAAFSGHRTNRLGHHHLFGDAFVAFIGSLGSVWLGGFRLSSEAAAGDGGHHRRHGFDGPGRLRWGASSLAAQPLGIGDATGLVRCAD